MFAQFISTAPPLELELLPSIEQPLNVHFSIFTDIVELPATYTAPPLPLPATLLNVQFCMESVLPSPHRLIAVLSAEVPFRFWKVTYSSSRLPALLNALPPLATLFPSKIIGAD